ncbi:MAG: hypothetical protein KC468_03155 [Myxococcales bacterium]|nr:hypothetical protein [Myxococcales bacterium]
MQEATSENHGAQAKPRARTGMSVYRHRKRPSWGLAALLWEHEGKRGYQFEDGRVRVFADGYFDLMEPVQAPKDPAAARTVRRLAARRKAGETSRKRPMPRVADQIGLFMQQFPEGFTGEAWLREVRGKDARRVLKRHRDPAVTLAAEQLARGALAEAIEFERWGEVRDRAVAVLRTTDLVRRRDVEHLAALAPTRALAWAIYNLLHGDQDHARSVDAFARELERQRLKPSWPLVTALPALRFPMRHVCVRPSAFREQLRMVKPSLKPASAPTGRDYLGYLEATTIISQELEANGRTPRDLLDVAHFIWITLRRAARERLSGAGERVMTVH